MGKSKYEEYRKKIQEEQKAGVTSSNREKYIAYRAQNFSSSLPERINKLNSSKNEVYKKYTSRLFDEDGKYIDSYRSDTSEAIKSFATAKSQLDNESRSILEELNTYEKYLDSDVVKKYREYLSENDELSDVYDMLDKDHQYFSQWENEEAYSYSKSQAEKQKKYSAMSDDELEAEIEKLGGKSKGVFDSLLKGAKKGIQSVANLNLEANISNSNTPDSVKSEILGNMSAERNENTEREFDLSLLQQEKKMRKTAELDKLPENVKNLIDEYTALDTQKDYTTIENIGKGFTNALNQNTGGFSSDKTAVRRKEISEELKALGVENWQELIEYNRIRTDGEKNEKLNEQFKEVATEHPWLTSAATVLASPAKMLGAVEMLESAIAGSEAPLNYNSPYFIGNKFVNETRETVMENYDWEGENTNIDWFDQLYSAAMSSGDSIVNMALTGGSKLGGAVLGLGAMSDTAQDIARNGGSKEQAILTGILAGANEMLWEAVSIGKFQSLTEKGIKNLVSKKGIKTFIGNTLKSVGVNASEEFNTEAANLIVDYLINGGFSSYGQAYNIYREGGYTDEEARTRARNDMIYQSGEAGFGGALQGLLMGGLGSAVGSSATKQSYKLAAENYTAEDILKLQEKARQLGIDEKYIDVENASGGPWNSEAYLSENKLAELISKVDEAEETASKKDVVDKAKTYGVKTNIFNTKTDLGIKNLRKAVSEIESEIAKKSDDLTTSLYASAIKERLVSLGENDSQAHFTARSIIRDFNSEALTEYEAAALKGSNAQKVYREFMDADSNEWVQAADNQVASAVYELQNSYKVAAENTDDSEIVESSEKKPVSVRKTSITFSPEVEFVAGTGKVEGIGEVNETGVSVIIDGAEIPLNEVEFKDEKAKSAYEFASQMETKEKAAAALRLYNPHLDRTSDYKAAFDAYYNAGLKGLGSFEGADRYITYGAQFPQFWREDVFKAGRADKAYTPGVNRFYQKQNLSVNQKTQLNMLDKIGNKYGISFLVFDNLEDGGALNGVQIAGTNKIAVALNADGSLYLRTAGHECFHIIEEWNKEAAQELTEKVINYLKQSEGYDYDSQVEKYAERYGVKAYTEDGLAVIHSEMAADSMFEVFSNEDFVTKLAKENKTLTEKLKDFITKFISDLRNMMKHFTASQELNALREQKEALEDINKSFIRALEAATTKMQESLKNEQKNSASRIDITEKAENGTQKGGVRYSFVGFTRDGRRVYTSDFAESVPQGERIAFFKKRIATIFNLGAVELKTDVKKISIRGDKFTAQKNLYGDLYKSDSEGDAKINALYDLADILATSKYIPSATGKEPSYANPSIEPKNKAHKGVKYWYKFKNEIIFDGVPYTVTFSIRDKGTEQYQYLIEFKENKTHGLSNTVVKNLLRTDQMSYINNVSQNSAGVNSNYTQESVDNSKTRKSIKLSSSAEKLLQSSPELQIVFKDLQRQTKLSNGYIPEAKRIHSYAYELKKTCKSTLEVAEIEKDLRDIYEVLSSMNDAEGYQYATELTAKLSEKIVSRTKILDRENAEIKELRDRLKTELKGYTWYLSPGMKAEIENRYGSYNNFRKKIFGKGFSFSENSTNYLDSSWSELCKEFPTLFDINTPDVEQPLVLLAAFEATEFQYGLFGEEYSQQTQYMAAEILNALTEIPAAETARDRLSNENYKRIAALEAQNKEKLNAIKEEHRNEFIRFKKQAETDYRWKIKKHLESQERAVILRRVEAQIVRLSGMLAKGTKNRHIPLKLIDTVRDLCYAVTLNERAQNTLGKNLGIIEASYVALKEGKDGPEGTTDNQFFMNEYDEYVHGLIQNLKNILKDKSVGTMTLYDLKFVDETVRAVAQSVSQANDLHMESRNEGVEETANAIAGELGAAKVKREFKKEWLNNASDKAEQDAWKFLKPVYAWRMMGSDTFGELMGNIRKGEDTWAVDMFEARAKITELAKKYNKNEWSDKNIEVELSSGTFNFSVQQLMMFYVAAQREQYIPHLLGNPSKESPTGRIGGGFVFEDAYKIVESVKDGKKAKPKVYRQRDAGTHGLTEKDLEILAAALTKEQKGYADEMRDYLAKDLAVKGNEITRKLYDFNKFTETKYFPIKVAREFLDGTMKEPEVRSVLSTSILKDLQENAANPVLLRDFDVMWAEHVQQMAMFHSFALPLDDFRRVYDFRTSMGELTSVKTRIETACGNGAVSYIENFIKDVNGGVRAQAGAAMINELISKFKKGAVFASASVTVQQGSAIARALAEIDPKYFTNPTLTNKDYEELQNYAPVARIKAMGFFDTSVGQSTVDWLTAAEYGSVLEKIKDKEFKNIFDNVKALGKDSSYRDEILSKAPEIMDEITWCNIWHAVKNETMAKTGLTGEELLVKSGERFTEVIELTQVYDSVFTKSELMRSKDTGAKMVTSFMAESTVSLNMLVDAAVNLKHGKKEKFGRIVGAFITSVVLNNILKALVTAPRDEDEEKTLIEKYIAEMVNGTVQDLNPLTLIPLVKDVISIFQGYGVERADMSIFQNLYDAVTGLSSDKKSAYRKIEDIAGATAAFIGLPVKNIMRDIRGVINLFKGFSTISETSADGIKSAVGSDKEESLYNKHIKKILFGTSEEQLYNAIKSHDYSAYEKLQKGEYGGDKNKTSAAIRESLKAYDERITQAAEARLNKNSAQYSRLVNSIKADGFSEENIIKAVNSVYNELSETEEAKEPTEKAYSLYTNDDLMIALETGGDYNIIIDDLIETAKENGKTTSEAEKSIKSNIARYWKPIYIEASETERKAIREVLDDTGLYEDIEDTCGDWVLNYLKEQYKAATSISERASIKSLIWATGKYKSRANMNRALDNYLKDDE